MGESTVATNGKSSAAGVYATLRVKRAKAVDGTGISYEVVGTGPKTVMLANGLGGRLYAWSAVIDVLYMYYRFVTWDYRGLFDSDSPESKRRLAVAHHVEDARSILDAEGIERAVFMGWSMGVQVSLDMAASYPERVGGLILLNGTYGHVLSTGLQQLFAVPWLPKRLHALFDFLQDHPELAEKIAKVARVMQWPTTGLMSIFAGRNAFRMKPLLARYFDDVLGKSFVNYLRLFQELDAHSRLPLAARDSPGRARREWPLRCSHSRISVQRNRPSSPELRVPPHRPIEPLFPDGTTGDRRAPCSCVPRDASALLRVRAIYSVGASRDPDGRIIETVTASSRLPQEPGNSRGVGRSRLRARDAWMFGARQRA